ncbi:invasion associated locus B family protein [Sneathiella glossodoripedis]|uniref:invasion associated locus B family protein n=1 Tax=Sneathiella glossodoripedis TaxID=418853 RepID=UPI00046EEDC6|nr:invasion associated locus B family protein [Sneathiella glossodoripedis]
MKITSLLLVLIIALVLGPLKLLEAASNDNWKLVCKKDDDPRSCHIEQRIFLNKKVDGEQKQVGRLLNISVFYTGKDERKPFIIFQLPLGVDLQAGMALQIDKSAELKAPFAKCTNDGCEVRSLMTRELLDQLKKGTTLKVGFRPHGVERTMVVNVDLMGFTRAFSWLD